jgi:hypothetical protein
MRAFQPILLNLVKQKIPESASDRIKSVAGSGLELKYPDQHFDLLFSNSVIEHVGTWENQQAFASEARRVGKQLWIQTPAQEFFLEPHYMTPFIHWFPIFIRRKLIKNFTLWGLTNRPTDNQVEHSIDELRLLKREEMVALFPDCLILEEKFIGLSKSYIAIRT